MKIAKEDFGEILKQVKDAIEYGQADVVMCKDNFIDKSSYLYFYNNDPYEFQLFCLTHPDHEHYQSLDLRNLFEIMDQIDKGKIPAREFIPENNILHHAYIDVASIIEERQLIEELHQRMKKADWSYGLSEDFEPREKGRKEIENIRKDLTKLSSTQSGMKAANQLWELYAPQSRMFKQGLLFPGLEENPMKNIQDITKPPGNDESLVAHGQDLENAHKRGRR